MAARLRIIILERREEGYNCALWADVPAARQTFYADPNKTSKWTGATTADNDALKSGAVLETVITQQVQSAWTRPQIEAFLQTRWQDYQDRVNANNPWANYGSNWDGTTWSRVTVP